MTSVQLENIRVIRNETLLLAIDYLEIRDGELLGILGPSGAGKTTLLRLIAGLDTPTSGSVVFDGVDVTAYPPRERHVAMVFQDNTLLPNRNVRRNVAFPLEVERTPADEISRRVEAEARVLEIGHLLDRDPHQLGAGHQQLAQAARALVRVPKVFLMDEPLAQLDLHLRVRMRQEFRLLQQGYGVTTLLVTNDQEDAMVVADRIAVLDKGWVQQIAAPLDLYHAPANRFVGRFIGSPPMGFVRGDVSPEGKGFWLRFGQFQVRGWSPGLATAPDGHIEIGIRPEDVVEDPHGTPVPVGGGYFLGSYGFAQVELAPGAWVEMRTEAPPPPSGTTVTVRVRRLHVFNPITGVTLARVDDATG